METPHSPAMDDDEVNFENYPKVAIRCIKDPIFDQSTVYVLLFQNTKLI